MKTEVEIKVKVDRKEFEYIKKILPAFGKFFLAVRQTDEYYTPPHKDFFAKKPLPDEWLRIRTDKDKKSIFEYNKSFDDEKKDDYWAKEYESEISDPEEFKKILSFLDFKKVIEVDKKREYWICNNFEVSLDEVKDLGFFVEVEASGVFKSTKEARKGCINFLEKLGIKNFEERRVKVGYPILLLERKR
jgi:adenylate cyclase class 2